LLQVTDEKRHPGLGGDMGGFEQYQFDQVRLFLLFVVSILTILSLQDVEQGRAASDAGLTGSQRPSMLPWAQEAATSDAGGLFRSFLPVVRLLTLSLTAPLPGFGGPSSQPGAGSRVSLDTPLHRGFVCLSSASLIPS
jgi:hypothetical protein